MGLDVELRKSFYKRKLFKTVRLLLIPCTYSCVEQIQHSRHPQTNILPLQQVLSTFHTSWNFTSKFKAFLMCPPCILMGIIAVIVLDGRHHCLESFKKFSTDIRNLGYYFYFPHGIRQTTGYDQQGQESILFRNHYNYLRVTT